MPKKVLEVFEQALQRAAEDCQARPWGAIRLRDLRLLTEERRIRKVRQELIGILKRHGCHRAHEHAIMKGEFAVRVFHQLMREL